MADEVAAEQRWWLRAGLWSALAAAVYVLGVSGYLHLRQLDPAAPQTLSWPEALYRGVRLFALNVDLPDGTQAPWWLWVAAVCAPVLLAGGLAALLRNRISGVWVRLVARPRVVVFGATGRAAALVESATADTRTGTWRRRWWAGRWWRRDVVVVVDPDPNALAGLRDALVHTVTGDGTGRAVLRRAAVRKAREIVVATGDAVENSAITVALLGSAPTTGAIHVEVDDAGLAETLEQGGLRAQARVSTFDAVTLTAVGVLDDLGLTTPWALAGGDDPTVLVFGTGPLVDAFVLELFRRQPARLHRITTAPALRIAVFGPDAASRCAALCRRMAVEPPAVEVEAVTVHLDRTAELTPDVARHLTRFVTRHPPRQVLVAVPRYVEGGGVALTLARRLGPGVPITLVTEAGGVPFGAGIVEPPGAPHSTVSTVSTVRLYGVPQRAYGLEALRGNDDVERLARALYEVDPPDPARRPDEQVGWPVLGAAQDGWRQEAGRQIDDLRGRGITLRRAGLVPVGSPDTPLLRALGVRRPSALALAGLRVDFTAPDSLVAAARALSDPRQRFEAWCEVARLRADAGLLAADHPETGQGSVDRLLLLRRAVLDDTDACHALPSDLTITPGPRVVVLIGGHPGTDEVRTALDAVFLPAAAGPAVFATGDEATRERLGPAVAAAPAGRDGGPRTRRRRLLDLWTAIVTAGAPLPEVRVLLLPGAGTDEILLARAMGATIGRPQWRDDPDPGPALLNGATGIVPLPRDPMTVRAFLNPGQWPPHLAEHREPLAAELHRRYVTRQRPRKRGDDPALRPWSALSPWLRESNLAMVDDIPNKLAAVGLELDLDAGPSPTAAWRAEDVARLAEMEHGRFTAERLQSGWAVAARDPAQFLSPYLVPWAELDDAVRDYDREAVEDLPPVLAQRGIGLRRGAG